MRPDGIVVMPPSVARDVSGREESGVGYHDGPLRLFRQQSPEICGQPHRKQDRRSHGISCGYVTSGSVLVPFLRGQDFQRLLSVQM